MSIIEVIDRVRREPSWEAPGISLPGAFECKVLNPAPWDRSDIEGSLRVGLSDEFVSLWNHCGGMLLYEDVKYGQWGLDVLSPVKTVIATREYRRRRPEHILLGDMVFAEFIGDLELAVFRGDTGAPDYGAIVVATEMGPRSEWSAAAGSLEDFLTRFMDAHGDKYWEPNYERIKARRALKKSP